MIETMTQAEFLSAMQAINPAMTFAACKARYNPSWLVAIANGIFDREHCELILAAEAALLEEQTAGLIANAWGQVNGLFKLELNQARNAYAVFANVKDGITPEQWQSANELFHKQTLTYIGLAMENAQMVINTAARIRKSPALNRLENSEDALHLCGRFEDYANTARLRALTAREALNDGNTEDDDEAAAMALLTGDAVAPESEEDDRADPYAEVYNDGFVDECQAQAAHLQEHVEDLKAETNAILIECQKAQNKRKAAQTKQGQAHSRLARFANNIVPKSVKTTKNEKKSIEKEMQKLAANRLTHAADQLDAALAAIPTMQPTANPNTVQRLALWFAKVTGAFADNRSK